MWQALIVAVLVGIGTAGEAQAQSKKELIAKLVQLQQAGIEDIGSKLASQTSQRALQTAGEAISRMAADKREAAVKDVQAEVKKFHDQVEPLLRKRATELAASTLSPSYEEKFSDDELMTIVAWLDSPVSKKFRQVDADVGANLAKTIVSDMRPTIEPKLKSLEVALTRRVGALNASGGANASGQKK